MISQLMRANIIVWHGDTSSGPKTLQKPITQIHVQENKIFDRIAGKIVKILCHFDLYPFFSFLNAMHLRHKRIKMQNLRQLQIPYPCKGKFAKCMLLHH